MNQIQDGLTKANLMMGPVHSQDVRMVKSCFSVSERMTAGSEDSEGLDRPL